MLAPMDSAEKNNQSKAVSPLADTWEDYFDICQNKTLTKQSVGW